MLTSLPGPGVHGAVQVRDRALLTLGGAEEEMSLVGYMVTPNTGKAKDQAQHACQHANQLVPVTPRSQC